MKLSLVRRLAIFLILLTTGHLSAKEIPKRTSPPRLVNDFAGILNQQQQEALEKKLVAFDDTTSNQIAIVIENSLEGEDARDYSQRLAESWGIGQAKKNNGILIYVAVQDRTVDIEVGYGLEPVITDGATGRIRRELINPNFKEGRYYEGLDQATTVLMKLAVKEFSSAQYEQGEKRKPGNFPGTGKIIFFIILIIIIIRIISRRGGGGNGGRKRSAWTDFTRGTGPFLPWIGGGGFGGGGFGGGFGGGGGGFGGFGGGSFGGGGSSGRW